MRPRLHKMKRTLLAALTLISSLAMGQNLVDNGSFEITGECPVPADADLDDVADPWTHFFGTPDYYNAACNATGDPDINVTSQAFDGNGFMGIQMFGDTGTGYVREYLHGELNAPLEEGKYYRITFYVRPVNQNDQNIGYGINNIGLALTDSVVDSIPADKIYDDVVPQVFTTEAITTESYWTAICGIYYAKGGEEFITIGNFNTDVETQVVPLSNVSAPQRAYYLIDYVQVVENDLPQLPEDTIICDDQRIDLHIDEPDISVQWNGETTSKHFIITAPGIYTARITDRGCSYTDTIFVNPSNCNECKVFVPNAFSPNGDGRNDVFTIFTEEGCEDLLSYRINIFDRWGQKVFESNSLEVHWDGDDAAQGVYTYTIEYEYPLLRDSQTLTKRGFIVLVK